MKIKATKSFCGQISMAVGEIKQCTNEAVLKDLLRAGYVVPVEEQETENSTEEQETEDSAEEQVSEETAGENAQEEQKPTAKRSRKKDESK